MSVEGTVNAVIRAKIQNDNFVSKTRAEKNDEYIDRSMLPILLYVLRYGMPAFECKIATFLEFLQTMQNDEIQDDMLCK